jgi:hypothetical protein
MEARSPEGKREEGGAGGDGRSFAVAPPRAATGQQE